MRYFFINYKLEKEASGKHSSQMTKVLLENAVSDVRIIFVPQLLDLQSLCALYPQASFFCPHADFHSYGKGTGYVLLENVKESGAVGVVLNHAEHKLPKHVLRKTIFRAKRVGLKIMACADSLKETEAILELDPDFIAYEPPELIGGDVSVSQAQPQVLEKFSAMIKDSNKPIIPITGAGIKTQSDVRKAVELGTSGIFVASGIVRAKNPKAAFEELLLGF